MEADKITADTETDKNNGMIKKEIQDRRNGSILIAVLPVLAVALVILSGFLQEMSGAEIARAAVLTVILTAVVVFYIRLYAETVLNKRLAKTIIVLSYLGSIVLLMAVPGPSLYSLWMIGGLLAAMLLDHRLGLIFHFSLSFILGILYSPRPETIIHILIIGVIMNLLSGALRNRSTVVYAVIIVLSTNVTLSFTINNFVFDSRESYNYLYSMFSMLAVLASAFVLCLLYDSRETDGQEELASREGEKEVPELLLAASVEEESVQPGPVSDTSASYEVLCSLENELMVKLKEHSEALYEHALRIAEISGRAAGQIGAGEQLAYAGGLYHEIGKIKGKNYIEEGLAIAEEYAFPKELKAIVKEHNIKYDRPGSVEAAIVMLTDSVVSTIEYISGSGEHKYAPEKIIDNIFQMRMEKGSLDQSGLSLRDYKLLKEFYLGEYRKKEKEGTDKVGGIKP
ncbi:hypothetical protein HNQ56_002398 [Anaerotaenia torta]|uniref:HD domain-containing protein n=1 Tax=Anaerotaenia torta TaxID=433293 RepID=UPI003D197658